MAPSEECCIIEGDIGGCDPSPDQNTPVDVGSKIKVIGKGISQEAEREWEIGDK